MPPALTSPMAPLCVCLCLTCAYKPTFLSISPPVLLELAPLLNRVWVYETSYLCEDSECLTGRDSRPDHGVCADHI
jgi:hypothetical protein